MSKRFITLSILPFMLGINVNAAQQTMLLDNNVETRLSNLETNVNIINKNIQGLQHSYNALAQNQQKQSTQLSNMAQEQEKHFARLNTIENTVSPNKQLLNYPTEDEVNNAINNSVTATNNFFNTLNTLPTHEAKMEYIKQCGLQGIPGIQTAIANNTPFDEDINTQIQSTIAQQLSNNNPEELQQAINNNYGLTSNNAPQENYFINNTPGGLSDSINNTIIKNPYTKDNTNADLNTSNITTDGTTPAPVISTNYDTILGQLNNATNEKDIEQIAQQFPEVQEIINKYPNQPLDIETIKQEVANISNNNQINNNLYLSNEKNLSDANISNASTFTVPNESFTTDINNISPQQREQILHNNEALLQSMNEEERQNFIQNGILPENNPEVSKQLADALEQQTVQNNINNEPTNIIDNLRNTAPEDRALVINQYIENGTLPQISEDEVNNYIKTGELPNRLEFIQQLPNTVSQKQYNVPELNELVGEMERLTNAENRQAFINDNPELKNIPGIKEYITAGKIPDLSQIDDTSYNSADILSHSQHALQVSTLTNPDNTDFKPLYKSVNDINSNYDSMSREELVQKLIESNNALQTCERNCKLLQGNKTINNNINSSEPGRTVSNGNIVNNTVNNTNVEQPILQYTNTVQTTGVVQDIQQGDIQQDNVQPGSIPQNTIPQENAIQLNNLNQQQIMPQNNPQMIQQAQANLANDNNFEVIPTVNSNEAQIIQNIESNEMDNNQQIISNPETQEVNNNQPIVSAINSEVTLETMPDQEKNIDPTQIQTNQNIDPKRTILSLPSGVLQNINENNGVNINENNDNTQIVYNNNEMQEYNALNANDEEEQSNNGEQVTGEEEGKNEEVSGFDLYNNEKEHFNNGKQIEEGQGNTGQDIDQDINEQQDININKEQDNMNQVDNQIGDVDTEPFNAHIDIKNINQINNQQNIGDVNEMNIGEINPNQVQIYNQNEEDMNNFNLQNIEQDYNNELQGANEINYTNYGNGVLTNRAGYNFEEELGDPNELGQGTNFQIGQNLLERDMDGQDMHLLYAYDEINNIDDNTYDVNANTNIPGATFGENVDILKKITNASIK